MGKNSIQSHFECENVHLRIVIISTILKGNPINIDGAFHN
jgi:hypothetical protein